MRPIPILLILCLTVFVTIGQARDPYPRQEALDVEHYVFRVELNDSSDVVFGQTEIRIRFRKAVQSFFLDLASRTPDGLGMTVRSVISGEQPMLFSHTGDRLTITLPTISSPGQVLTLTIQYDGKPTDGLIISKNKFGDRTFFADHWPDRGHLWLPCIDHPSDKASIDWIIVAPGHYRVIATGRRLEETLLPQKRKLTHYRELAPVAVKVMAMGVARFSVKEDGPIDSIEQSTWVFPQNEKEGFQDFAPGLPVFRYFQEQIGPFAYSKLAHVQSKTRWGGLENAGNIFYSENSVASGRPQDHLIAHEAAHQWFGDAVTESDWHHVWLSEGFANYFANLYFEHAFGQERFKEEMRKERERVIQYYRTNPNPIVDTTIQDIKKVLNTNVYQKGCWALHMLRREIGDDAFWSGIRSYYALYRNGNVLTQHFQEQMEKAAKRDLSGFFRQWLYRGGHPKLTVTWQRKRSSTGIDLRVTQEQASPMGFPLVVRFILADGSAWDQALMIRDRQQNMAFTPPGKVVSVVLDPDCNLLFEGSVKSR
jgi:aminopeptidase N